MSQKAIGVEKCAWKQAVSIVPTDDLTTMEMSGEDQIVAGLAGGFPDSRVVSAQHSDIPFMRRCGIWP
jgi:hypothetical protein